MDAETAVAQLFQAHLGLSSARDGGVRGFRDLFAVPALTSLAQKRELLRAAERTECAGVIMDALLFVSQTMARDALHRELASAPIARQLWIQHELSGRDGGDVAQTARTLLAAKAPAETVASVLLDMAFPLAPVDLPSTLSAAREVLRVATRTRPHRLPAWAIEQLAQFVALGEIQLETEQLDAFLAPPEHRLEGYLDKRARGANSLNANWRMRFFQLDATELRYSKHDAATLAQSPNPFLDTRLRGRVELTRHLVVEPLAYVGKVSRRPYCIKLSAGGDDRGALIVDACTPVGQAQWLDALQANVRRLGADARWLQFPRRCVLGMPPQTFLRYALLYHHDADPAACACHPSRLQDALQLSDKRVFFASVVTLAELGAWDRVEGLVDALGPERRSSAAAQWCGYGPILDVARRWQAPLGLQATLARLRDRHDRKKPAAVWSSAPDDEQ
ncbi:hypothetical protein P43SY_008909 [Pythium insidiosum]|uniref:PH domain-containing protein n=1 Tax=Pythium insidiosum TaxID=114742 RepID=A0AAD5LXH0_PYTIN|nr:hypothetical protein P43SY_008909 [Pythium insidiosum]